MQLQDLWQACPKSKQRPGYQQCVRQSRAVLAAVDQGFAYHELVLAPPWILHTSYRNLQQKTQAIYRRKLLRPFATWSEVQTLLGAFHPVCYAAMHWQLQIHRLVHLLRL